MEDDDPHQIWLKAIDHLREFVEHSAIPIPGIKLIDPAAPPDKETDHRVISVPGSLPEPPEHSTTKIIPWIRVQH